MEHLGEQAAEVGAKAKTVIVNGRPKKVRAKKLSFEEVIALAFDPVPTGDNVVFTVKWRSGKLHGRLVRLESVEVLEGMIFNVVHANKS